VHSLLAKKWGINFYSFPDDIVICHKPASKVVMKKPEKY
jgi:uncharacterized NAD-dependent epimerase/dehydratase family protein